MDYSLLVGIHDTSVGNTECIRDHQLQVVMVRVKVMQCM